MNSINDKSDKFSSKKIIINGKNDLDLEELIHPYFKSQQFTTLGNNKKIEILSINPKEKLLLFSPHPDDEILGACGLIYKCFSEKIELNIIYMTNGKTAGDPKVRKKEAKKGIKILGGQVKNLLFTNFPFYVRENKLILDDDFEHARELIIKFNPTQVFLCADIFDPNRTHKKCFEILMKVLQEDEFREKIKVFFYFSVWYWPEENEYTHILPYDYETYKMKIYAFLEHKSQMNTKYMGNDSTPFYQRATARDKSFGNIHNFDYCEVYYALDK